MNDQGPETVVYRKENSMKILRMFLPFVAVSLCSSALAAVETEDKVWTAPKSSFEMTIPEDLQSAKGVFTFSDTGVEVDPGSGLCLHG